MQANKAACERMRAHGARQRAHQQQHAREQAFPAHIYKSSCTLLHNATTLNDALTSSGAIFVARGEVLWLFLEIYALQRKAQVLRLFSL
jgi:hypothetical protein